MEDEEIARLIEKQKAAGLHTITDGEFRRSYWHLDFFWGFQGITHIELEHGYQFHGEETTRGTAIVTGKIGGENHPFVEHFKYVKGFEDDDTLLRNIMESAQLLCMDVARITDEEAFEEEPCARIAVMYAVAYLYEHREEADHHALTLSLRSLLFGCRQEGF